MTDRADESYRLTPEAKLRLNLRGVSLEDSIPLIRAYGDECRNAALEEAEQACHDCDCDCAAAIRALKEKADGCQE